MSESERVDAPENVSRRDFARRAAAVVAGSVAAVAAADVAAAGLLAMEASAAEAPSADVAPVGPAGDCQAEAEKPAPIRPPHELHLDLIRQQFPHEKLTPETLDLIRADIAGDLGRYRALDKYPLLNGDEPGFVFRAWRADG